MSYERLEVEREGPILRVWLNRPDKLNALDTQTLEEIERLFTGLQTDFDVRVAVLGGRGRSFSAGADLNAPPAGRSAASGSRARRHSGQIGLRASRAIEDAEVITIARIHGHAVGGAVVLALACDFRIAAEGTFFLVPEVDLGVPLTWGATPRMIQEIGAARARELILLCDRVDAKTAETWGITHRTVPAADLDAAVDDWAKRLAEKPEVAVHMTKTQFRAYAQRAALGDVRETDGDVLREAARITGGIGASRRDRTGD